MEGHVMASVQRLLFSILVLGWSSSFVLGAIIHVPGDQATIQDGVDAAISGVDEVVVAAGTYGETIDFGGKAITVRSSGGAAVTTIDGTGLGATVVVCNSSEGSDSVLEGFTITGGSGFFGGGMSNSGASPTVRDCVFDTNPAGLFGGGIYNTTGSAPTVIRCVFIGNSAGSNGAGVYNTNSTPVLSNCAFIGNVASNNGGGVYNDSSDPTVRNCTFQGNSGAFGGGMYNGSSNPGITNCIFWQNSDSGGMDESAQIHNASAVPVVNFCNVQGGWTGTGGDNLNVDPNFVNAVGGNLRLLGGSPCVNAGDNSVVTESVDLDGNPRIVNGTVDMGAYESSTIPADRDADGDVDGVDFSVFASCFNKAGNPPRTVGCDAGDRDALDFDDDSDIDGFDFSMFASCFNRAGNPPRTLGCPQS